MRFGKVKCFVTGYNLKEYLLSVFFLRRRIDSLYELGRALRKRHRWPQIHPWTYKEGLTSDRRKVGRVKKTIRLMDLIFVIWWTLRKRKFVHKHTSRMRSGGRTLSLKLFFVPRWKSILVLSLSRNSSAKSSPHTHILSPPLSPSPTRVQFHSVRLST